MARRRPNTSRRFGRGPPAWRGVPAGWEPARASPCWGTIRTPRARGLAAALFPHSDTGWQQLDGDPAAILEAMLGDRANRRQRAPRPLEHAQYAFEVVANFAAYRDLHRHRMLTQERQLLGTALGYDVPPGLAELGMEGRFRSAIDAAALAHSSLERD